MQDKKKQILEAAIRCFARKGFHATSIQEIADELGMAKGSIYFYFKSKDDVLISVFEYYVEMLFDRMEGLPEENGLPPRERLMLQLERQFAFFRDHLDFMQMLTKEPVTGVHPEIQQLMLRFRSRIKLWNISHIIGIYGNKAENCSGDASILLSGIIGQYFEAILFEEVKLDDRRLSRFIVKRLDDIMQGIQLAGEAPILPKPDMKKLREQAGLPSQSTDGKQPLLEDLRRSLSAAHAGSADKQEDLVSILRQLEEEMDRPAPNRIIVRGMLALLKQNAPEAWLTKLEQLEEQLIT
jgi:AcrR family transcriptional regulator